MLANTEVMATIAVRDIAAAREFYGNVLGLQESVVGGTAQGEVKLSDGGARLWIDGKEQPLEKEAEYPSLYRRFAGLVKTGGSDVDVAPLRHVADAFMLGKRKVVDAFHD